MFLDFVHCLMFLKTMFLSSGKIMAAAPTLLGRLEGASCNPWTNLAKRIKTYKHLRSGFVNRR
jgi:hypothetical protein